MSRAAVFCSLCKVSQTTDCYNDLSGLLLRPRQESVCFDCPEIFEFSSDYIDSRMQFCKLCVYKSSCLVASQTDNLDLQALLGDVNCALPTRRVSTLTLVSSYPEPIIINSDFPLFVSEHPFLFVINSILHCCNCSALFITSTGLNAR